METIGKKYRVIKLLGQGAMGEVFLVSPPRGDPVALKLLKTGGLKNQKAAVEQFENEFKVLKKLSHPNIGHIHDYGYDGELDRIYFTSPWLRGSDFFAATKESGNEQIEELLVQLLRALNYLHQKNIIHCDLKPGNIYVENGQVLLIDFGLAGYWGKSIAGTPTYLAPEIFRGERHSIASDLYAVGVIFYNALGRMQPFSGKTLQEIYERHRTYTPPSLTDLKPEIPKYLSDIALNLLAKKPSERYPSAAAVIEEIAAYSGKKYSVETQETLLSYLPTASELIGRKEAQWGVEKQLKTFLNPGSRKAYVGLFLHGEHGVGKSKFVEQIKTRLQLEKVQVEEAILPLSEADRGLLRTARAILVEDMENYVESGRALTEFLSLLEQKVLSPETTRMMLVVTGTSPEHFRPFAGLFPAEEFSLESIPLSPFTEEDMAQFVDSIVGQKGIPLEFMAELYRNTGGNPGLASQLIRSMIERGLLFDEGGRWSPDLLANLGAALAKMETPGSLEDRLRQELAMLSPDEREVMIWLGMAPHGLTGKMMARLAGGARDKLLDTMLAKKLIRREEGKLYLLYRSTYVSYLRKTIPAEDQKRRHDQLSRKEIGLEENRILYHVSLGSDQVAAIAAKEALARTLSRQGRKEGALEYYHELFSQCLTAPLSQRVDWAIGEADNLIWLDRFSEAATVLERVEREMKPPAEKLPLKKELVVWEKKGLAYLHQLKLQEARDCLNRGLTSSEKWKVWGDYVRFLNDLAQIEVITGNLAKAEEEFLESRERMKSLSKEDLARITNNDLGNVYFRKGEFGRAISLLKKDVKFLSKVPYPEPCARAVYTLAESYRSAKKYFRAARQYEKCAALCKKENLFGLLLRAYNGLGNLHMIRGRKNEAITCYQRALDISVHLREPTTKAALLVNQGIIYRRDNNLPQASRRFLLAKQILESIPSMLAYEQLLLSKCYNELSAISLESQDATKALSFQMERLRLVEEHDTLKSEEFSVMISLAELYLKNRLTDQFEHEIEKLRGLAKTEEERVMVTALEKEWKEVDRSDQDRTLKVEEGPRV